MSDSVLPIENNYTTLLISNELFCACIPPIIISPALHRRYSSVGGTRVLVSPARVGLPIDISFLSVTALLETQVPNLFAMLKGL